MLPYFIGLQSVPKVALAPLFVVWFGLGISSKIVLGVLLTFFPLMVNTAAGLRQRRERAHRADEEPQGDRLEDLPLT